jgi:hypothetical protein
MQCVTVLSQAIRNYDDTFVQPMQEDGVTEQSTSSKRCNVR